MVRVVVALFVAAGLFGQEPAFERLKREAARTKALSPDLEPAVAVTPLHSAMRDWIESRLPQKKGGTADEFSHLEATLQGKLRDAGLSDAAFESPGLGYIGFEFKLMPELPDSLFVVVHATVECGSDDAVYLYQFGVNGLIRMLEDRPKTKWGHQGATVELSDPDSQGRRLLLTHYTSAQCASFWMAMAYSVYRLGPQRSSSDLLLAGDHGYWLGNDGPEFVLKPEELIIEFLDRSLDLDIHNRAQIHRYSFAQGVQRLDPVALQPQDFVEEWLTRPWSEMQSRSAAETQESHERLHGEYVGANYSGVIPCAAMPGRWLIGLEITNIGDKELKDLSTTYFLVHDLGNYHYKMDAVSKDIPEACPGKGSASDKHPWLTTTELKALADGPHR